MEKYTVLIVDDEEPIRYFISLKLGAEGYRTLTAANGMEAMRTLKSEHVDLVLLDLIMPQMDGVETLKEIRSNSTIPVIIVTAKNEDESKVRGLNLGADDYLSKPFSPEELLARIKAVRRRLEPAKRSEMLLGTFSYGQVLVDFKKHKVTMQGTDIHLTPIEWRLLGELMANAGRFVSYDDLLSRVWGPEYKGSLELLHSWMSRLRRKIEKDPHNAGVIRTIFKSGYIIEKPGQAGEAPAA